MLKILQDIKDLILSSKKIIIASHIDPDGDTLGSMIALGLMLKKLGKDAVMYSPDGIPATYEFLPGAERVVAHAPREEFDLLIAVDASDISRIGKHKINARKIVNIDHHPDNSNYGDINYVEMISSVAEPVFRLAGVLKVELDPDIATALYVSIITDTGNFKYSNTLPSTFEIAKELMLAGASPSDAAIAVYENKRIEALKILAHALMSVESVKQGRVVYAVITHQMIADTKAHGEDLVGIIDHIRSVRTAEVAILFREEQRCRFKINFRSKGKVNVSNIARALGGGGHVQASGCEVEGEIEDVKKKVLDQVLREFK